MSSEEQEELVRNLLLLFPQSMRAVAYTTFATEPDRETYFKLMLIPPSSVPNLSRLANFLIVRLDEGIKTQDRGTSNVTGVESYLASIVFSGNSSDLEKLHEKYNAHLRTPLKKTVTAKDLLSFCYKEIVFEKATGAVRLGLGLELAQGAPSSQLAESYYSLLMSETAQNTDSNLNSRILSSYILFLFGTGQTEKANMIFSKGFERAIHLTDSAASVEFVSNITKQISNEESKEFSGASGV